MNKNGDDLLKMVFEPGTKTWWISPGVIVSGLDAGPSWNQETRKSDDLNYSLMIGIRKTLTLHVECWRNAASNAV